MIEIRCDRCTSILERGKDAITTVTYSENLGIESVLVPDGELQLCRACWQHLLADIAKDVEG